MTELLQRDLEERLRAATRTARACDQTEHVARVAHVVVTARKAAVARLIESNRHGIDVVRHELEKRCH